MLKHEIESKMSNSQWESDSIFAINPVSDFYSDSDSESDSHWVFMNLVIFAFFVLYLHSPK